jgi:hypothetical protein
LTTTNGGEQQIPSNDLLVKWASLPHHALWEIMDQLFLQLLPRLTYCLIGFPDVMCAMRYKKLHVTLRRSQTMSSRQMSIRHLYNIP